jgi:hypothetical protein
MDPVNVAGAFATIVGLISNYKSENQAISSDEYKAFLEWLQNKHHTEVIQYIEMNSRVVESIKHFLEQDNNLILQKLEAIDNVTAKIASGIEGLAEIAKSVKPNQGLSKQCISILKQLNESGSHFSELKTGSHPVFLIVDGNGGTINYDEPRFIEDDIRTLVELRLLRLDYDYTKSGTRIFYLTREATSLLQT